MNSTASQQTNTPTNWPAVCGATMVWWVVPLLVRLQPRTDELSGGVAFGCLLALAVALSFCARFRQAGWIVLIWLPVFVWTCLGAVMTFGAIAGEPHGGPNAAPLEGVATLIALAVALALSVAAILCLVFRPRLYPTPLIVLAVVNTGAISFVTPQANRQATRQDIVLRIIDPTGKPVPAASVRFERYGYGPGGTDVFDARGGPLLSGVDGVVTVPSRRMRYETRGTISKPGFRGIDFTVEMQYSEWDTNRGVTISTPETPNIARGHIPTAEPVTLSIYLPPVSDVPNPAQPIKRLEANSDIGQGSSAARFFNIETGKFSNDATGDLRFDIFFEMDGQYERPRLRITGLNEAQVLQVAPNVSFTGNLSDYEHVFRIAPQSGYQNETVVLQPGSSPGPMIYIKARGGKMFARMTVDASGRRNEKEARCRVHLYLNPAGSRLLE